MSGSSGSVPPDPGRAGRGSATQALLFGVIAMVAVPLAFILARGPTATESVTGSVIQLAQYGGLAAALAALLLGRRARIAGDRSMGAVWGPRLGAAALMGFIVTTVGLASGLA